MQVTLNSAIKRVREWVIFKNLCTVLCQENVQLQKASCNKEVKYCRSAKGKSINLESANRAYKIVNVIAAQTMLKSRVLSFLLSFAKSLIMPKFIALVVT